LCYLESNQLTSAGNALEKAVQLAPREPECWLTLGKLHLAQDRRSLAVASIQQALKIAPPTWANAEYAQQLLTTAKDGP
jgi:cytochrome c-type biogenesis protein CcmH/NrfG